MATITDRIAGAARDNEIFNVSPTLFIGLGGSGKEVLMRLRRLFYTNIREIGLPINQYLWIDTDIRRQNIQKQDYDPISDSLYFPQTDTIDVQVLNDQLEEYFDHPANYGHIFEWLHHSIKELGFNIITNGAGQVPPCGRVAFFHHYKNIRKIIECKINNIGNSVKIKLTQEDFKFQVDATKKNVFLIASVAGGTGAGMLLDTAFLLKDIAPNLTITGIIFLPSIFKFSEVLTEDKQDIADANGYASLMQLDYFMSPRVGLALHKDDVFSDFNFRWDGSDHRVRLNKAPFDTIYFLGRENCSGKQLNSFTESFQMAAESIYLEFCNSDFGAVKRSIRPNNRSFLINEPLYEESNNQGEKIFSQYFPARYSSFGLSFIKLDIDRRRNAAAYFFGKSLAEFWNSGKKNSDGAVRSVDSALEIKDAPGKKWDYETIEKFLLKDSNSGGFLLNKHEERIEGGFQKIKERIEITFGHKSETGLRNFLEKELDSLRQKISQQSDVSKWQGIAVAKWDEDIRKGDQEDIITTLGRVVCGWNKNKEKGIEVLGADGHDSQEIDVNATSCLKEMKDSYKQEFDKLLAMPGDDQGKAGRSQVEEFCKKYKEAIEKIYAKFVKKIPPDLKKCLLEPIIEDENIKRRSNSLKEAQGIRVPLFGKTAVTHCRQESEAGMKKYSDGVKDELIKAVEVGKEDLLKWYCDRFHNYVCEKAKNIFGGMIKEIVSDTAGLNAYEEGLGKLAKGQKSMFDAYNKDYADIRHHYITKAPNDNWYKDKTKETLKPGSTMSWENFLDGETNAFIKKLLNIADKIYDVKHRQKAFKHIFDIISDRKAKGEEWKDIQKKLELFCFKRMEGFLLNTDADAEFQKSKVDKKQKLAEICGMADAWFLPSTTPATPQIEGHIGVPPVDGKVTVSQARNTPQFTNSSGFSHEKGNIIFYKEVVAFPLYYLDELNGARKIYDKKSLSLNEFYRRHIDYRLINRLRPILPPGDQQMAEKLFEVGKIVLEALILGCLHVGINEEKVKELRLKLPWHEKNKSFPLGAKLNQAIRILSNSSEKLTLLKENIDKRKEKLKDEERVLLQEEFTIVDYYQKSVFPSLLRAGTDKVAEFDSNHGLICNSLREHYLQKLVRHGNYTGVEDPKLEDDIAAIDLEKISNIFPFEEEEAQDKLRILK